MSFRKFAFSTLIAAIGCLLIQPPAIAQYASQSFQDIVGQPSQIPAEVTAKGLGKVHMVHMTLLTQQNFRSAVASIDAELSKQLPAGSYAITVITPNAEADLGTAELPQTDSINYIFDAQHTTFGAIFGQNQIDLPFTFILDKEGNVAFASTGYRKGYEVEFLRIMRSVEKGDLKAIQQMSKQQSSLREGKLKGQKVPDFTVTNWIQFEPKHTPEKYKFVELWATWCGPCIQMMPHTQDLYLKHQSKVSFYNLSTEEPQVVEAFLKRNPQIVLPIGIVDPHTIVQPRGIPFAYLVDPNGVVVWEGHPGEFVSNEKLFEKLIAAK
jgi:cytochrome c biogenesis protein CcmG/thiol:disulfide interchange protein DsbE